MWKHWKISVVELKHPWMLTDGDLSKLDLPNEVLACLLLPIFTCNILWNNINLDLSNLVDNFLNIEIQKSIERRNLLRYQPML